MKSLDIEVCPKHVSSVKDRLKCYLAGLSNSKHVFAKTDVDGAGAGEALKLHTTSF
jgi:hypothetical protein